MLPYSSAANILPTITAAMSANSSSKRFGRRMEASANIVRPPDRRTVQNFHGLVAGLVLVFGGCQVGVVERKVGVVDLGVGSE